MRIRLEPENLITIVLGIGIIATGFYGYHYMGRFLDAARQTSGTVVEVVYETGNRKGRIHPVVRFKTVDGSEIVAHSDQHHNVQRGDTVELLYDPRDPQQIEITTLSRAQNRRLLFVTVSIAFGVFVCVLGLGVIRIRG
jgi:hypothetical protein